MNRKQPDWISLIETSYDLEGSDPQWLRRILDHVSLLLNRGSDLIGRTFHCTPTMFQMGHFAKRTPKALTYVARMSPYPGD